MAEYYPLLAKAVSALDVDANEARQVLYERARKALIGQLRNANPALPQAHIDGESKALDLAIARLEAEYAVKAALRGGMQAAGAAPRPGGPTLKPVGGPQLPQTPAPSMPARPIMPPATTRPPAPIMPAMPTAPPRSPQAPVISPITPSPSFDPATDPPPDNLDVPLGATSPPPPAPAPPRNGRLDLPRPVAPVKAEPQQRNLRGLIVVAAILALVGAVAAAALWLRQSPEDLARITHPLSPAADPASPQPLAPQGKIEVRVKGAGAPAPPAPAAPAPAPAGSDSAESSVTPVKVPTTTLRPAPPQVAPATPGPTADAGPAAAPGGPTIPVAHRAAILQSIGEAFRPVPGVIQSSPGENEPMAA